MAILLSMTQQLPNATYISELVTDDEDNEINNLSDIDDGWQTDISEDNVEIEIGEVEVNSVTEDNDLTDLSDFSKGNFIATTDEHDTGHDDPVGHEVDEDVEIFWSSDEDDEKLMSSTPREDISFILSRAEEERRKQEMLRHLCPLCADVVKHFTF